MKPMAADQFVSTGHATKTMCEDDAHRKQLVDVLRNARSHLKSVQEAVTYAEAVQAVASQDGMFEKFSQKITSHVKCLTKLAAALQT